MWWCLIDEDLIEILIEQLIAPLYLYQSVSLFYCALFSFVTCCCLLFITCKSNEHITITVSHRFWNYILQMENRGYSIKHCWNIQSRITDVFWYNYSDFLLDTLLCCKIGLRQIYTGRDATNRKCINAKRRKFACARIVYTEATKRVNFLNDPWVTACETLVYSFTYSLIKVCYL